MFSHAFVEKWLATLPEFTYLLNPFRTTFECFFDHFDPNSDIETHSSIMSTGKNWTFGQCFGEKDADEEFSDADVLSAVKFDDSGDYLATGDKGGRIVIFERTDPGKVSICCSP